MGWITLILCNLSWQELILACKRLSILSNQEGENNAKKTVTPKKLSFMSIYFLGINGVIGSGAFLLPQTIYKDMNLMSVFRNNLCCSYSKYGYSLLCWLVKSFYWIRRSLALFISRLWAIYWLRTWNIYLVFMMLYICGRNSSFVNYFKDFVPCF